MDTVWLKLTDVDGQKVYLMFGPTGIVGFSPSGNGSSLTRAGGGNAGLVQEDPTYIMNMIGQIRKTIKSEKSSAKNTKISSRK